MNDLKFTTAGDYIKDQEEKHEPPEPCFMIEGEWAYDTKEEYERAMGRKVPSEKN